MLCSSFRHINHSKETLNQILFKFNKISNELHSLGSANNILESARDKYLGYISLNGTITKSANTGIIDQDFVFL